MALAIIDDIGAILIIAVFYTSNLSIEVLYVSLFIVFILFVMNRLGVSIISLYIIVGIILFLKSSKKSDGGILWKCFWLIFPELAHFLACTNTLIA